MTELTPEQLRAVERRSSSLMVRAGAGTGKTTVLVERFVRAATVDATPVESILAITFTEKAAAELKTRVRTRLLEEGRRELARAAESAWISTIHGFCSSVLRAHALSAGIDPDFRVLDELESERLALDAFDAALEAFMDDAADPARIEMVAAYTPDRLRDMVRTAYSHLRSRGQRHPRLDEIVSPRRGSEIERLGPAARAALAELGTAESKPSIRAAVARLEEAVALAGRLAAGDAPEPVELDRVELRGGNARALSTAACQGYRDALADLRALAIAEREHRDHTMLRALIELYDERYDRAKRARSGLDFEDLELVTRDLFATHEGLRLGYAERFAHILVDEFQDTNPLQNEVLGLLARDNLFRVGDENQSIYRFRNADVGVFREHWRNAHDAGEAESITVNFRARPELIDAIDLGFERIWDGFEPLRAAPDAGAERPAVDPCVELIVVDRSPKRWTARFDGEEDPFGASLHGAQAWRAAEARLLARRIEELTAQGPYDYGDVVMLFRATTAMGWFERALEERGIPVHVVGGRGYWGQQQVADLRNWLAALANPLDEAAVYSVLASPLAGLSLDAVALVGLAARRLRRDAWWTLADPDDKLLAVLPDVDRRRLTTFVERFEGERRVATQISLEALIDRAVTRTGYDRHLLALPGGARRMANVRKLMRMARDYESEEGRDLRGFADRVAERDELQTREGEAPLEGEAAQLPVRMMTVHRAKGLEFPVVCVCDLGKDGREDGGSLQISDDGDVGLRLAGLGGSVNSDVLERIKAEAKAAGESEERRIFYVAMTRAQEHLILSGATDLERRPEPVELREPMRWIWRSFCAGLPAGAAEPTGFVGDEREGRVLTVRYTMCTPDALDAVLAPADRAPTAEDEPRTEQHPQPSLELGLPPAPRALPVSRLSYSGLEAYRRCGYRFYLERALGLARVEPPPTEQESEGAPGPPPMTALLRGSIVHALLERLDFRRPALPGDAELEAAIARHGVEPRAEDVDGLRAMLERVAASALRERIAATRGARTELPFAFTLTPPGAGGRSLLVNGVVDVHVPESGTALVVDWKSDALDGREPEDAVLASYSTQRLVYALAALRGGAKRVEVAHCFLERPDEPAVAVFEASNAARLEGELLEIARGVVEARFEPSSEPNRSLCGDCPGRAALCIHPPELTLRDPVEQASSALPSSRADS